MVTDSLYYDIPSKEFADSLFSAVNVVSRHTDNLHGFSAVITAISVLASLITIAGIIFIWIEFHRVKTTRKCQEKIILDLIRHFFTNNAISEVIRMKMAGKEGLVLKEGILQRYCVLDSDIELGNLSYSAESYDTLHSLRMKLRNYNIAALAAEKHFTDAHCPDTVKEEDLDDILDRSIHLTEEFIDFAEKRKMKVNKEAIRNYIRTYYEKRKKRWEEEGRINNKITIPKREPKKSEKSEKPKTKRDFYDKAPYELKDIEDLLIRERYSYVKKS